MDRVSVVKENGSFRLVECAGRFAVIEARAGQVFGVPQDREGSREGASECDDGIHHVARWTGETEARALLDELSAQGDHLARRML